jgi:hypothetical protein
MKKIKLNYKKLNYISFFIIIILFIIFFYGTSLSCDYRIKLRTPDTFYDGVCELGKTSWIETQNNKLNGSIWHVTAWSFSLKNKLIFLVTNRKRLHKNGNKPNNLDLYNEQLSSIKILNYEYSDLSKHHIAIFSVFPEEHVYVAEIHGSLSLFSEKKSNRKQ